MGNVHNQNQGPTPVLNSLHNLVYAEGPNGSILVTCNGRLLYTGNSWEDVNQYFLKTFYGITRASDGNVQIHDRNIWNQNPFMNVMHSTGLDIKAA